MKKAKIGLAAGATVTAVALLSTMAAPVFAATPATAEQSQVSTLDTRQSAEWSPEDAAIAATIDQLTVGVDQATSTYDARNVPAEAANSDVGERFAAEFARSGGTVIAADGLTSTPSAEVHDRQATAAATGRIWQDAWGVHMTLPEDTMDRLSTLALTGSAGAGSIAALLAVNVEGFPISTTGALASGGVAIGLIAASGALQVCNINGNGAQLNYNWVLWTCWPL
ncbi:hypothetical protein [Salinibacterium sp. PAMC 21357]|uniref:hypothetical protein n=1 Tax=Salinibacterium sp. PAMC 21357 TaxID=1112215 RepID=UPI0002890A69|nr:hypothetical protein [Salinibacterium sp. PAMC 21357]